MKPARGPAEIQFLGDSDEVPDVTQFHTREDMPYVSPSQGMMYWRYGEIYVTLDT